MHQSLSHCGRFVSVLWLAVAMHGCGDNLYETAEVTGTVTCNGQPAYGGTIRFRPIDAPDQTGRPAGETGREAYATVEEDGTFHLMTDTATQVRGLTGAVTGPHEVFFDEPVTRRPRLTRDEIESYSEEMVEEMQATYDAMPVYEPLSCGTKITPNRVEVKAGEENVFEFTIE